MGDEIEAEPVDSRSMMGSWDFILVVTESSEKSIPFFRQRNVMIWLKISVLKKCIGESEKVEAEITLKLFFPSNFRLDMLMAWLGW